MKYKHSFVPLVLLPGRILRMCGLGIYSVFMCTWNLGIKILNNNDVNIILYNSFWEREGDICNV